MINKNLGSTDKILRIVFGVFLLSLLLFLPKTLLVYVAAIVGVVLVVTAVINFCPLYSVLGIKTNKMN